MDFIQPPDNAYILSSEQHDFEQWLDQMGSPQSGLQAVSVENMEVDQIEDQNGEENLLSMLENVVFRPGAEEAEDEGQKFMQLDQGNVDQGAPTPEDTPPPLDNVEVQEASGGKCAVAVEQTKQQKKRKADFVGPRQQPKRECKERQSRKTAFEQEIKSATLQLRRNRSEISKEEHQQARRNASNRR